MITKFEDLDLSKKYTYADYLTWRFSEMVELIRGKIFKMSPAPNLYHQEISSNMLKKIFFYLEGKPCKVFHAPFDVRLPLPPNQVKNEQIDTVVQPDISVICDLNKLDIRGCLGAPDWIIEILSPSTASKDLREKFELYEFSGVREYWIVHPHEHTLLVYKLDENGKYMGQQRPYVREDQVAISIFDDFVMNLADVFPEP
ncbi:MAG TPA: Uma2 family endonuclease [Saprospiraceae bacterium]|nr:Uma2 family endonuclease [Saprospiraceae bacterium]